MMVIKFPAISRIWPIFWILLVIATTVLTVPVLVQKRQSDQRVAELETLLALHKYGVGGSRRVGGRNSHSSAGYGLIDFNYIGRKKKSLGTYLRGIPQEGRFKQMMSSWPHDDQPFSVSSFSSADHDRRTTEGMRPSQNAPSLFMGEEN